MTQPGRVMNTPKRSPPSTTIASAKSSPSSQEAFPRSRCCSFKRVDAGGPGGSVLVVPFVLVDEEGKGVPRRVSEGEILAPFDRHSKAVMRDFYRPSEFCSSCHKAA